MSHVWQLHEAKDKLGQVVARAISEGPQVITRHGKEVAVVISVVEYRRLTAESQSLTQFFRPSPLAGVDIELRRDQTTTRQGPEP
jgi:antitoxin Phd